MRRSSILACLAVAAAASGAQDAHAKIACGGVHPAAEIELEGLPAELSAGPEYHVTLDVPRARPSNMRPILMFIGCRGPAEDEGFNVDLPGAGEVEFPLRFSEPGSWRATLMDRGGVFHSLGTFDVLPALAVTSEPAAGAPDSGDADGDGAAGILAGVGAVGVLGAAGAWGLVRRRPRRGQMGTF